MIDHKNHFLRYSQLMGLVCRAFPARQRDGGYTAAIYILSADPELFSISVSYANDDGISFACILRAARRHELTDSQITALYAAHSLFNDGSRGNASPSELSLCDLSTLDLITNALFIRKGLRRPVRGANGEMLLDRRKEAERRAFEAPVRWDLTSFAQ